MFSCSKIMKIILSFLIWTEHCQPFLAEEFDVQRYANTIIESEHVAATLESIAFSVSQLDKELNRQVSLLCLWSAVGEGGGEDWNIICCLRTICCSLTNVHSAAYNSYTSNQIWVSEISLNKHLESFLWTFKDLHSYFCCSTYCSVEVHLGSWL